MPTVEKENDLINGALIFLIYFIFSIKAKRERSHLLVCSPNTTPPHSEVWLRLNKASSLALKQLTHVHKDLIT